MSDHLEQLVREWREAQRAIDRMSVEQRRADPEPLTRLVAAHHALVKYADEKLG